jgi:hypothetical protein
MNPAIDSQTFQEKEKEYKNNPSTTVKALNFSPRGNFPLFFSQNDFANIRKCLTEK